jgi:hypothetical protein
MDKEDELLRHAFATIGLAIDGARDYEDWFRVEQILLALSSAVRARDIETLRRLVADIEHIGHAPPGISGGRYPAPIKVRDLFEELDSGLRRLIKLARNSEAPPNE